MRIMPSFTLVALAAVPLATAPAADGPAPPLPATVAVDLKEVAAMCTEAGGKALAADAVKRVDLNGDGNEDFVFDVGSIACDGAASIYGDREKSVTVYVGDGQGGAVPAFRDMVYGMKIEGSGTAARLWLTVAGEACGRKPAPDFASESFCDRPIAWNAAGRKFAYAPVSTVRMIQ